LSVGECLVVGANQKTISRSRVQQLRLELTIAFKLVAD